MCNQSYIKNQKKPTFATAIDKMMDKLTKVNSKYSLKNHEKQGRSRIYNFLNFFILSDSFWNDLHDLLFFYTITNWNKVK